MLYFSLLLTRPQQVNPFLFWNSVMVWPTLTRELFELAFHAFQEKVFFLLLMKIHFFLVILYSVIFEAFYLC